MLQQAFLRGFPLRRRRSLRLNSCCMNLKRAILQPIAWLAGRHAAGQLAAWLAAHQRSRQTQDELLRRMVAAHERTDFGRDHGFARVRTYADFAAAVAVGDYEARRPYLERVLNGELTALLPAGEDVVMFSRTSGTTGSPKHIPVTRRFLAEMRRGWNVFGLRLLSDHPRAWLRPLLTISSSMHETTSPRGVPCGAISGMLAATQKRIVRRMYVAPLGASEIADPLLKQYTLLRCGVALDVSIITTANPSSTIKLMEVAQAHAERLIRDVADGTFCPPLDAGEGRLGVRLRFRPDRAAARRMQAGVDRDGVLLPRHFWNIEVLANWTGGTLKLYLPRLRELFGDVAVRDIGLLASEGRFSIPLTDGTAAGVAEITGNFLEFIPAEEYGRADARVLRAHELDAGAEYFLVVTNWAGLWRYSMDDRVRVTGHFGRSAVFEFLSRGKHTANITGEKVTEWQVVEAMRRASAATGAKVQRFTLQGVFAAVPYYRLAIEESDARNAEGTRGTSSAVGMGRCEKALAAAMDDCLRELNVEYAGKRSSGRLGAIRAAVMAEGFFDAAEREEIRRRLGRGEQYKHQYLLTDVRQEG